MAEKLDCRGKACPQPVIMAKKLLEQQVTELEVIVDNQTACENVTKLAQKMSYKAEVSTQGDDIILHLTRKEPEAGEAVSATKAVFLIASDALGRGEDELGKILAKAFFPTLTEVTPLPQTLIFINTGVRFVASDSPALDSLKTLAESGVAILACGTCLDYFGLKEQVAVGTVSNMYDIVETLSTADKVISL